jgi:type I restriction enzyme R subunit
VDARTEITTELLSEKGYSMMVENDEGVEEEQFFFQKDFERKFFSDKTNHIFCKTFMENALKDPISGEIGKSIVFCVSQKHASKITQTLNQFADKLWPGKYNSDFAIQVTSNITDAQQFPINFSDKSNNLTGHTKWLEGYKSSKTRVCVTVGMMTTGYDCQDILNIGLLRPIFSPTDFIQIKGRGTRKYTFIYKDGDGDTVNAEKATFKLFDFFANCEYFESKYDYDQIIKLPKIGGTDGPSPDPVNADEVNIFTPDPLKTMTEKAIGLAGMKVDWKFFEKFESAVKSDPIAKEKYEKGDMAGVEAYVKDQIFDKPEDYFNLEKLRKSVKADRRISLREIIEKVFGGVKQFKSKNDLLEEECEKFIAIQKPESKYIHPIKNFLKSYITDPEIRDIIETKQYARFATNPKVSMQDYKDLEKYRGIIPDYVKDYVSLNAYL